MAQVAILPITAGLILAAASVLVRQANQTLSTLAITCSAAALAWRTQIHPLRSGSSPVVRRPA